MVELYLLIQDKKGFRHRNYGSGCTKDYKFKISILNLNYSWKDKYILDELNKQKM